MPFSILRRSFLILFAICLASALPQAAVAWGNDGHQMVNQSAVQHLPASMPAFLKKAEAQIIYLGPEPDRGAPRTTASSRTRRSPTTSSISNCWTA